MSRVFSDGSWNGLRSERAVMLVKSRECGADSDWGGPAAEGGWNLFKATICLEQTISSLSRYERLRSCACSISLLVRQSGTPKHVTESERYKHKRYKGPSQTTQTIKALFRGGGTPTYRLASRWHPHSFRRREKRINGRTNSLNCGLSTETLTLWSVRLLPALRRLRRPTVRCRQDPPGGPLSRAKLAGSFAVTRFRLLHFHLDKRTSGAHLARPVKGPWSCSATQPCTNTGCLILDYWATFKYFTLVLIP